MKKFLKKIRLWWKFDGRYMHLEFQRGVKNLIKWFPIIWRNREWDHAYIYDILAFKLKTQAEYTAKYGHHEGSDTDAQKMQLAVRLIDKVSKEFYQMEYSDYRNIDMKFIPTEETNIPEEFKGQELFEMKVTTLSESFDEYFKKYPRMYVKVMTMDYDDLMFKRIFENGKLNKEAIALNIAHMNHERAKKLLFKLLETHISYWWN